MPPCKHRTGRAGSFPCQLHEPRKNVETGAGRCKARVRFYFAGLHSISRYVDRQRISRSGYYADPCTGAVPVCKGSGTAFADRPMPELPPVTMTTLLVSSATIFLLKSRAGSRIAQLPGSVAAENGIS